MIFFILKEYNSDESMDFVFEVIENFLFFAEIMDISKADSDHLIGGVHTEILKIRGYPF